MQTGRFLACAAIGLAAGMFLTSHAPAQAQDALAGKVASAQEGAMEGVVVTAKRDGGTIAISVVSDAQGHFAFPASRLEPGHYALAIRAVGYDLEGPRAVEVTAGSAATADITLRKTKNLAAQLSNAEWLASIPGTDAQKKFLLNCLGCHSLQRIVTSTHDAAEFKQVLERMSGYYPGSMPIHPQRLVGDFRRNIGNGASFDAAAAYLASINLSEAATWDYKLQTFPRLTGRSTRVVVTEYDLPRQTMAPHDVIVDDAGTVWFSNFGEQALSTLDPATGKVTEYPIDIIKPGFPTGTLDLEPGPGDTLWVGLMFQGGIARFDKQSKSFTYYPLPTALQANGTQQSMVTPTHAGVDGKVWTKDVETNATLRLDVATGRFENLGVIKDGTGRAIGAYGIPSDAENNLYFLNFGGAEIGRLDAKTLKFTVYPTPTPHSRPRRGRVDAQDRLWFAEYGADRIAMFDPKTEKISEWPVPTPWTSPYDVVPAANGEVWTASMLSDRVDRLEPKSGAIVEYPLPRPANIRRVFVDNRTSPNNLWVGSVQGASIIKVEPLD